MKRPNILKRISSQKGGKAKSMKGKKNIEVYSPAMEIKDPTAFSSINKSKPIY